MQILRGVMFCIRLLEESDKTGFKQGGGGRIDSLTGF